MANLFVAVATLHAYYQRLLLLLGTVYPLNLTEARATVTSSGFDPTRPPALTIDGIASSSEASCSSLKGVTIHREFKTWLRVDIHTVLLIREVQVLFYGSSGAVVSIFIGRGLRENGAYDNTKCGTVSNDVTGSQWETFTCPEPVLGQFIYIDKKKSNSMRVCEIKVFYGNVKLAKRFYTFE